MKLHLSWGLAKGTESSKLEGLQGLGIALVLVESAAIKSSIKSLADAVQSDSVWTPLDGPAGQEVARGNSGPSTSRYSFSK
ncbi:hypothetical protein SCHPADRAFT_22413 [Schizopora paradoxa]|uniref:Uncharacterized protein n=1 Tax=Schizopora paradoxa TaxID=27342 RepID=A0A0H2S957_9AGAM|nr:hypothetical protein SCHPADRAFT_22413 [Schizopora paradoxa]